MKHEDLPQRWKDRVKEWLLSQGEAQREKLNSDDFNSALVARIKFEDGSIAIFFYSLVIQAPDIQEIGIFTEHCGYHIFNSEGMQIMIEPMPDE